MPASEHHLVLGVSFGGYAAWQDLFMDPRGESDLLGSKTSYFDLSGEYFTGTCLRFKVSVGKSCLAGNAGS